MSITIGSEWAYLVGLILSGVVGFYLTNGFFKLFGKKRYYLSDNAVLDIQAAAIRKVAMELYGNEPPADTYRAIDIYNELMAKQKLLTNRKGENKNGS